MLYAVNSYSRMEKRGGNLMRQSWPTCAVELSRKGPQPDPVRAWTDASSSWDLQEPAILRRASSMILGGAAAREQWRAARAELASSVLRRRFGAAPVYVGKPCNSTHLLWPLTTFISSCDCSRGGDKPCATLICALLPRTLLTDVADAVHRSF